MKVHGFRFCFTPLAGVLFTFPSRYYALSVAARIQPWIVVDPDSDRVPRAPPYSGTASWRRARFAYGSVTLFGAAVRLLPLLARLITPRVIPMRPYNPGLLRFGLLRVRSPLLAESLLISFPGLLRWFTSPGIAPPRYFIRARGARLAACGLPHSGTRGSKGVCPSPRLFAACRALPRTGSPGRPPRTSLSLGHIVPSRARHHMASSARLSFFYSAFPSLCLSNIF